MARKRAANERDGEGFFARASAWAGGLLGAKAKAKPDEDEDADESPRKKRRGSGDEERDEASEGRAAAHLQEIKGLLLIALSLWLAVSMVSFYAPPDDPGADGYNWGGLVGYYYAKGTFAIAGNAGLFFCVLGMAWGVVLVARKQVQLASLRVVAGLFFVLSIACIVQLAVDPDGTMNPSARSPYGPGGWLAYRLTPVLVTKFGFVGLWILLPALAVVSFMLATEMAFYPALVEFGAWAKARREQRGESMFRSVSLWMGRLVLGLWDFVRGADIGSTAAELAGTDGNTNAAPGTVDAKGEIKPARGRRQHPRDEDNLIDDEDDVGVHVVVPAAPKPVLDSTAEERVGDKEDGDVGGYAPDQDFELPAPDEEPLGVPGGLDDEADIGDADAEDAENDGESPAWAKPNKPKVAQPTLSFEPMPTHRGEWKLPPVDLLKQSDRQVAHDRVEVEAKAARLEAVLRSHKVDARVVDGKIGATVILFELEVAAGTRMNKVSALHQEIAGALLAESVRIIAPLPGKSTVGVELPNTHRRTVRMSELVTSKTFDARNYSLPLFLGIDTEDNVVIEDLARMPHLLVAGTTGSGKSVCVNTILASFLLTRAPDEVQLILIDPKQVELEPFATIPHLMMPPVTDNKRATAVLNWVVEKMEGRYELFKNAKVKNIKGYNSLSETELRERLGQEWNEERTPRKVPYIVLVIDEFADLMMVAKKEAEQAVMRLAQKSRAVGIHLILATQRPSTDVITGVMKANLPCRIAFKVNSGVDSRVIIDTQGAEKLLGNGDMLYTPPGTSRIRRVQGALIDDSELAALVGFVCKDSVQSFNQELLQVATGTNPAGEVSDASGFEDAESDPLWDSAVRHILKAKRGSASLLQRAFGIGYTRASRLVDLMGERGILSDHKGSKAREVMITLEQWEEQFGKDPIGQDSGNE
ncbi:MAG: DNA translocase FtsK [Planctomycetota bacterium]|nr:DNA translocase FtsK [Planctomycetota bacterium]